MRAFFLLLILCSPVQAAVEEAVVKVEAWRGPYKHAPADLGSGVYVQENPDGTGYVLTNRHVIERLTDALVVKFPGGHVSGARVAYTAKVYDVAVLKIFAPKNACPVPLAKNTPADMPSTRVAWYGYGPGEERKQLKRFDAYTVPHLKSDYDPRGSCVGFLGTQVKYVRQGDSGGPVIADGQVLAILRGTRGPAERHYKRNFATLCVPLRVWLRNVLH